MSKTRHIQKRMSQRGITSAILDLVERFGVCDNGDKVILTKKNCQRLSAVLANMKKVVDKMAEKGGYTLVESGDSLITIYRTNSFNKFLATNSKDD